MNRIFFAVVVLAFVQGCVIATHEPEYRSGPPSHAPAHGYRAKYSYYYYPEVGVYFDLDRRLYFYMDSGWRTASRLPHDLRIRLGAPVLLDLDMDRPYERYDEHRASYPPGHSKKKYKKWK